VANCGQTGQSATAGCDLAIQAVTGTTAEPFVRSGCAQAMANQATPDTSNNVSPVDGCQRALIATVGTSGEEWVRRFCPSGGGATGSAVGTQSVAAGCELAIQAVAGTTAELFVRAGCAQAVDSAAAGSVDQSGDGVPSPDSTQNPASGPGSGSEDGDGS
jgi:hypothetical protein